MESSVGVASLGQRPAAHDRSRGAWLRGGAAAAIAAITGLGATGLLEGPLQGSYFFPSLGTTAVVALYFGLRPGLVTLALATAGHAFFFLEPRGSVAVAEGTDMNRLLAWVASTLVVTMVASRAHQATLRDREANRRLRDLARSERRARERLQALQATTLACSAARTTQEVASALLDALGSLGTSTVNLATVDERGDLRVVFSQGVSEADLALFPVVPADAQLPAAECARERRVVTAVGSEEIDARYPALAAWRTRVRFESLASIPVRAGGALHGVLGLAFAGRRALEEEELQFLVALADQAGQAIARARSYEAETRAREEAERVVAVKDRLLAIVGHDLRNPLSAIVTGTTLMFRRGELGARDAATLRRVATSADRMHAIIRDLLDFSVIRAGRGIPVQPAAVDAGELVRSVLAEFEGVRHCPPIELRETGDLRLHADPGRLAQVVSNLVGNAIQHGGGAAVRVELTGTDEALELRVHNGGRPIDPAVLPHVFEPFRRGAAGGEAAPSSGSVGLGLFIVEAIARGHDGAVRVESSPEAGTTFTVSLPRRAPDAAAAARPGA